MERFSTLRENGWDGFAEPDETARSVGNISTRKSSEMSVRHIWFCGLLLAALSGCATLRYQPPEILDDSKLVTRLYSAFDDRTPPVLKSDQRIVLSSGIREWDFLGFLQAYPNGDFRAMLIAEMGGKALDIEHLEETSTTRVLWSVPSFPKTIVQESVPNDIKHLFGRYPLEQCRAAQRSLGRNSLLVQLGPDHTVEYVFDKRNQLVVESFETLNGKLIRQATYDKPKDFPKAKINRLVPSRIRLKNLQDNYKLDIRILSMELPKATAIEHDVNEEKDSRRTANTKQTPQTRRTVGRAVARPATPSQQPRLSPSELEEQRALLSQQRAIERRLQALRQSNPDLNPATAKPAPAQPVAPQPTPYPQPDEALLPDPSDGLAPQAVPETPRKTSPLRRRTNRFIRTR